MKIAILTLFNKNFNYGGQLQAYALCKYLNNLGYDAYLVKYSSSKNPIYRTIFEQSKQYGKKAFFKKVIEKFIVSKFNFLIKSKINKRKVLFEKFISEYDKVFDGIYDDRNIYLLNNEFDAFISGSDQVWNPNAINYGFVQDFVENNKIKVSYAASIGRGVLTEKERQVLAFYLNKFDFISVREKTAKDLLQENVNKYINVLIDPTFLLDKYEWESLIKQRVVKEKYVFAYFFSNSKLYRKKILKYCKKRNLKLIYLPYAKFCYNITDGKGKGQQINSVGPLEFLSLIYYSECVFTDSFHGVALSLNLKKNFYVFERSKNTNVSMNSRIYDILKKFDLDNRLIDRKSEIDIHDVDFHKYDVCILKEREKSKKFLSCFSFKKTKNINSVSKQCIGCKKCVDACNFNAITFVSSEGANYPVVNNEKCINCGKCLSICPTTIKKNKNLNAYIGVSKCYSRKFSTSGGIFPVFASHILKLGGVVYGTAMNNLNVEVTRIDSDENIIKLQKTKYVESSINSDVINQLKIDVEKRIVLFSGTPCQIATIKSIFNSNNLIAVDVLCHGVPSQQIFQKYIAELEEKYKKKIVNYEFRTKDKNDAIKIVFNDGKTKYFNKSFDKYYVSFANSVSLKRQCYNCKFQDVNRVGDVSIGDAWGLEKIKHKLSKDKHVSCILINSEKGQKLFEEVDDMLCYKKVSVEDLKKENGGLKNTYGFVPYIERLIYMDNNPTSIMPKKDSFCKILWNKMPKSIKCIIRKKLKDKK